MVAHAHTVQQSLPESLICLYGKSQPDLCFHPADLSNTNTVLGGIVLPIDDCKGTPDDSDAVGCGHDYENTVIGALDEFKP